MDAEGAKRLPTMKPEEAVGIKIMELVKVVYSSRHWNRGISYRAEGKFYPSKRLVDFDLAAAFEIHEGRIKNQS